MYASYSNVYYDINTEIPLYIIINIKNEIITPYYDSNNKKELKHGVNEDVNQFIAYTQDYIFNNENFCVMKDAYLVEIKLLNNSTNSLITPNVIMTDKIFAYVINKIHISDFLKTYTPPDVPTNITHNFY